MRYFLALGLCVSILVSSSLVYAAEQVYGRDLLRQGREKAVLNKISTFYDKKLKEIYASGKPSMYDMGNLREMYPQLEQYSPFSNEILDKLSLLAFNIQNSKNPDEVRSMVAEFQYIVKQHFANIEVIFLAASLTEQDWRLGDPTFMKTAKEALYQFVSEGSTGLTPEKAVKVVTFGEEDILLRRQASGKLIKSDLLEYGSNFINIHQMENNETGKITKLYFDVTTPIIYAEKKRAEIEEKRKKPKKF